MLHFSVVFAGFCLGLFFIFRFVTIWFYINTEKKKRFFCFPKIFCISCEWKCSRRLLRPLLLFASSCQHSDIKWFQLSYNWFYQRLILFTSVWLNKMAFFQSKIIFTFIILKKQLNQQNSKSKNVFRYSSSTLALALSECLCKSLNLIYRKIM